MKSAFLLICLLNLGAFAFAQTTKAEPKVVVDNENLRVYEYDSKPGKDLCGIGKHSHPAHLTVMLTDANVTITSADGKVTTMKMKAGTTFWSEADTHTVINSGTGNVKCQFVEVVKKKN
jgi:hypothetical protein